MNESTNVNKIDTKMGLGGDFALWQLLQVLSLLLVVEDLRLLGAEHSVFDSEDARLLLC